MSQLYVPQGFAYNLSSEPITVDNAEYLLVTVAATSVVAELVIYNYKQANVITSAGAEVDELFVPVASVRLPYGAHVIKKYRHQYVAIHSGKDVSATAILKPN